ncbi:hypothetical protein BT96DRAFT_997805 [Gymnopus androsaceus JB14]|uniref:Uncharacterized protein n=1 Tax=Gymnopus androsaceus JB14 TaxID=1447944 RepID=A0A6A4HBV9_9AGAR|nr:hypothetical protein BT96DRAFT_997805 [Gymnopus androsaceus JB14]
MHHENYRPKVQAEYEHRMKENPEAAIGGGMNHLGFRVKIARELWAAKEQSERLLDGGSLTEDNFGDVMEDEARDALHERLVNLLQPLLDLLHVCTSLNFFVVGGAPPVKEVIRVSSGESPGLNPKKFETWHSNYFLKYVIGLFMIFMLNEDPASRYDNPRNNAGSQGAASSLALDSILKNASLFQFGNEDEDEDDPPEDTPKKRKRGEESGGRQSRKWRSGCNVSEESAEPSEEPDQGSMNPPASTTAHCTSARLTHMAKTKLSAKADTGPSQPAMPKKDGIPVYGPIVLPSQKMVQYLFAVKSEAELLMEVRLWDTLHIVELKRRMEFLDLSADRYNTVEPDVAPMLVEPGDMQGGKMSVEPQLGLGPGTQDDDMVIESSQATSSSDARGELTDVSNHSNSTAPNSCNAIAFTHSSTPDPAPTPIEPREVNGEKMTMATSSSDERDKLTDFIASNTSNSTMSNPSELTDSIASNTSNAAAPGSTPSSDATASTLKP